MSRQVLGGGEALAVDVTALAGELRRLWQENAQEGSPITRACTRNVVALCSGEEEAARASETIGALAGEHPARAFVVQAVDEPARLEGFLAAHCSLRAGGRHVCCEQISLHVGEEMRRRAAGAIVPLLVPDLPVFVWVVGAPRWDDPLLSRLLDVADRLVIDSRTALDPPAFLRDLLAARSADAWAPGDFEWSRLSDWRESIASLFDEPGTRALPSRIERVEISYGRGGSAVAAALLAGWTLDRLELARAHAGKPPVARAVLTDGEVSSPGAIASVCLYTAAERPVCTVAFEGGDSGLTSRIQLEDICPLPARRPFADQSVVRLLEDQLDVPRASPLYERALVRAAALLGKT